MRICSVSVLVKFGQTRRSKICTFFGADTSKVTHNNNNNNNNNNNKGRADKDMISARLWDFMLREFRKPRRSDLHCGGGVKSARIWQLNAVCIVPLVLSATGIIPFKLNGGVKLLIFRPGLYVVTQKAVVLSS
jgi:hypothetical protein